jgi:hypothetical protein
LFANGKPAATPTLEVVEERITEKYPDVSCVRYSVDHMNMLKNEDEMGRIEDWATAKPDVCIGALGDCGSCTKYLVYGLNTIEEAGVPTVGLIDAGFELDWKTNSKDFGRPLRCFTLPALAEVTDRDRIRRTISSEVFDEIERELVRPASDSSRSDDTRSESQTLRDTSAEDVDGVRR